MAPKPDFSGYVTKYGVKCTDGRTIVASAFQHDDGAKIPLVWQHQHNSHNNVLGHLILTHVADGVRADGYFNDTPQGTNGRALVQHGDITRLSIYANGLVQKGQNVVHGNIREGSLVMAGANPGAFIDFVNMVHDDGTTTVIEEEAIITFDEEIEHAASASPSTNVGGAKKVGGNTDPMPDAKGKVKPTADNPDPDGDGDNDLFDPADGGLDPKTATVQQIIDTMTDEQKEVMYGLIGAAASDSAAQSAIPAGDGDSTGSNTDPQEGETPVTRNVFDQTPDGASAPAARPGASLTHAQVASIFDEARRCGSLKMAVENFIDQHGSELKHGIDNISTLFPYDQAVTDAPEFISRRMEWVQGVLSGVRKTPFSRIRSWTADITFQEARAKGYVKGNLKKEEFIRIARRITTPQTVYKKQKLDRDDILDITEFDVVVWLQTEMRLMLDEELARAILIGDGRDEEDPDKISTSNVRPIYGDDELYVTQVSVANTDITSSADAIVDGIVNAMRFYRGSGNPVLYTTRVWLAKLLLIKDTLHRRIYPTLQELTAAMGVSGIVTCEALEDSPELIGVVVNLTDYTVGTDRGGEVSMFDFFDIDYNQQKYLMETRMSGAMTKYRGALALVATSSTLLPDPAPVTFDNTTGVATVPDPTGLHYTYVTVADDGTESGAVSAGAQTAVAPGAYVTYRAVPASTYEFTTETFEWTFRRDS
jgi:hypothetical protein